MTLADPWETRLVVRFRDGDARAMDTLFDRYADRVLGLAVRLTETREDAEEVAQEAFIRAFRQARQFRGEAAQFGPWLLAIVRNLSLDRRRQLRLPSLSLDAPGSEWITSPGDTYLQVVEREERATLFAGLNALPEEWRTVLILCDLEEIPHADAAHVLGRSTAATKSLLYRARRALRDRLTEE